MHFISVQKKKRILCQITGIFCVSVLKHERTGTERISCLINVQIHCVGTTDGSCYRYAGWCFHVGPRCCIVSLTVLLKTHSVVAF